MRRFISLLLVLTGFGGVAYAVSYDLNPGDVATCDGAFVADSVTQVTCTATTIPPTTTTPSGSYEAALLAHNPANYYRLDEPSGVVAVDYMGAINGEYGKKINATTYDNSNVIYGVDGPNGWPAIGLNGTNAQIRFPRIAPYVGELTIPVWFRVGSIQNMAGFVMVTGESDVNPNIWGFQHRTDRWHLHYRGNDDKPNNVSGSLVVPNQWEFFAFVAKSTGLYVYQAINGTVTQVMASNVPYTQGRVQVLKFNANRPSDVFMQVDVARPAMIHSALTVTDLQALFDAG